MHYRFLLLFALLACAVWAAAFLSRCTAPEAELQRRPNFVVFLADDLGYGDLACYGNPIIKTPHIDRLAAEGMRFTDCHAAGTVCSPSRASLLTGRTPYRLGFYNILGHGNAHLRREEITIAALMKQQGYDTCFVGKWHVTNINNEKQGHPSPGDHGFDYWFATQVNAFDGPRDPGMFIRNGKKAGKISGWYCDIIVREAAEWLKGRPDRGRPFFLLVCSHEPHTPISPPDEYSTIYDNEETAGLEKKISYGHILRTDRALSHLKKHYYGTVTQLDHAFGALMASLDELNLRENTFVLFTSDNGPETPVSLEESGGQWEDPIRDRCFGTPGDLRGMKRYVYEGGHRVPGIVRWPGHVAPGSRCDQLVNGTDILPTLCAMAGAAVPADRVIDGTSIVQAFNKGKIERDIPACWMFPAGYYYLPHMAMREGKHVIVGWFKGKETNDSSMDWVKSTRLERFALYDLKKDIDQSENLAGLEPERLERMSEKMKHLWQDIQDEGPVWEDWR